MSRAELTESRCGVPRQEKNNAGLGRGACTAAQAGTATRFAFSRNASRLAPFGDNYCCRGALAAPAG